MIVRLRAAKVVLSKEAKYRLHRVRIFSSFRRSFPSSSPMNSSSSQAYTSRDLSSAACVTSLNFLYALRNARKAEPPAKAPRTAVQTKNNLVTVY